MNSPKLLSTRPKGVVLSASQLDVFDLCKRKWAFQYILNIRTPPHPSAAFGSEVHGHLERWLKFATPPPQETRSGQVATRMLVNLPPPGTGAVEKKFFMETPRGHNYTGIIDWTGAFNARPTVIDHKTTGNWDYAKTAEGLLFDTQGIIYSVAGCLGFNTEELDLFWNYGSTGKRMETRAVKTTIYLPVVSERFEYIEALSAEVLLAYQNVAGPMELPPTPSACGAFGGCPFQRDCNLSNEERIRGLMGTPVTMAERMRQQAAAAGGNGVGAPAPGQDQQPTQQPTQANVPASPFFGESFTGVPVQTVFGQPPWVEQQQPPATFNPEGGPNPPESGQALPPPVVPAAAAGDGQKAPGRPRGAKNKLKAMGELPTTEQWAFMIGVQAALNGGPQSVEVLVQAGDLALAAFKAKFG